MGQKEVRLSQRGQSTAAVAAAAGLSQDSTSSYITVFPKHDADECNGYANIFITNHNTGQALRCLNLSSAGLD